MAGRILFPLLGLLLLFQFSFAQTLAKAKLSYKLISIQVKGANRLSPEQIASASGLKIGEFVDDNAFKQSAERLGNTGLFTELTYSYKYSTAGCALEFQVTENDKLVPIVFDNFVWFKDDELLDLLRSRVPLFTGSLPLGGELADQVARALNSLLAERKIEGKAEYLRAAKEDGPVDSYVYKVNFHSVVMRNFDFPGASERERAALEAAAKPLAGQDFLRSRMKVVSQKDLLPIYLARGYLKAGFGDAQAKVAQDGAQTLVDVSISVKPGAQYKLADLQWAGNTVFTSDKLLPLVRLKAGEPVDAVELSRNIEEIQKLYGTRGYLFARVDPTLEFNDAQSAVRYQLNVTEGEQFRMGELVIDGLDPDSTKKMAAQWQLKAGAPFDNTYVNRFFKVMYRDVGLHGSWNVVPKQAVNQQNRTVSVTLHFMPKA